MRYVKAFRSLSKFVLHPLIHTLLDFTVAQDLEKEKAEPKTPHFLSLNQDIVVRSKEGKCGLKYVIFSQFRRSTELFALSVAASG